MLTHAISFSGLPRVAARVARRPMSSRPALKYYSAWFCPFAHRATIALEHHAPAVPYEWEEGA